MLHIILLILKILGFLILGILALLLLVLLIVFLDPFVYRVEAAGQNTLESIKGEVRFRWLFRLLSGSVSYENGKALWRIRIAWKQFSGEDGEEHTAADHGKNEARTENEDKTRKVTAEKSQAFENDQERKVQKEKKEDTEEKQREQKKSSGLSERFREFWGKIKYTFRKICDNIRTLGKKKEKLTAFIEDNVHRSAFLRAVKEIRRLLRALCPQKADVWLEFGFGDPALTGYTLALLSLIYPSVGEFTRLQPDFENKVLRGKAYIAGRIRIVHILIPALSLLLDKNVRTTYHHIRRFKL